MEAEADYYLGMEDRGMTSETKGETIVAELRNEQGAYLGQYSGTALDEIARDIDADWEDPESLVITIDGQPHRWRDGQILDAAEYGLAVERAAATAEQVTYRFHADHLGAEWQGTHADGQALADRMTRMAEDLCLPVAFAWAPGTLCDSDECERYREQIDAIWQEAVDASARELWAR